jgi:hypothetical protein
MRKLAAAQCNASTSRSTWRTRRLSRANESVCTSHATALIGWLTAYPHQSHLVVSCQRANRAAAPFAITTTYKLRKYDTAQACLGHGFLVGA